MMRLSPLSDVCWCSALFLFCVSPLSNQEAPVPTMRPQTLLNQLPVIKITNGRLGVGTMATLGASLFGFFFDISI